MMINRWILDSVPSVQLVPRLVLPVVSFATDGAVNFARLRGVDYGDYRELIGGSVSS